jgi:DNA-binding NarL/FixJ family response regulator
MIKSHLKPIRVLIADDHALLRGGFQNLLHRYTEIEFVGEAENGRELVEMANQLKPDIVFTDINMPVMDGIQATRLIRASLPDTGIIGLTMYDEDHLIVDMLEAGARGYLVKNASRQEVIDAIHVVYEGSSYYCRNTSARLAQMIAASKFNPYRNQKSPGFSEREKEVIQLICSEYSNKEMAAKLGLSVRTIEGYREKIQEKMDVHSTAGIVVYAIQKGYYTPDKMKG